MTCEDFEFADLVAQPGDPSPDARQLAELRWHWDSAFVIECHEGVWTARFHGDNAVISARSAEELRGLIWDDYCDRKSVVAGPGERALRRLLDDGII